MKPPPEGLRGADVARKMGWPLEGSLSVVKAVGVHLMTTRAPVSQEQVGARPGPSPGFPGGPS